MVADVRLRVGTVGADTPRHQALFFGCAGPSLSAAMRLNVAAGAAASAA